MTGGNGFIGQRLIHCLLSNGYQVRALARSKKSGQSLESMGVEAVSGDILDYGSLKRAVGDLSTIFHVAGLSSFQYAHRKKLMSINVDGTRNIIRLVKRM